MKGFVYLLVLCMWVAPPPTRPHPIPCVPPGPWVLRAPPEKIKEMQTQTTTKTKAPKMQEINNIKDGAKNNHIYILLVLMFLFACCIILCNFSIIFMFVLIFVLQNFTAQGPGFYGSPRKNAKM